MPTKPKDAAADEPEEPTTPDADDVEWIDFDEWHSGLEDWRRSVDDFMKAGSNSGRNPGKSSGTQGSREGDAAQGTPAGKPEQTAPANTDTRRDTQPAPDHWYWRKWGKRAK